MKNKKYRLVDDQVIAEEITKEELEHAREMAKAKMNENPSGYAMRSCWNCNSAHNHFLSNINDGFLFACLMGCGAWYYQGIDITVYGDES